MSVLVYNIDTFYWQITFHESCNKETLSPIIIKYKYIFLWWVDQFRDPFFKETLSPIHQCRRRRANTPAQKTNCWMEEWEERTNRGQATEKSNNITQIYFLQSVWPDEDKEQRLLPKRQAVGWRNERKGQTEKSDNSTQVSTS